MIFLRVTGIITEYNPLHTGHVHLLEEVRRLLGEDSFFLLAASALGGALLLTACDLAARLLFAPYEVPLGVVLSLTGGPFFIWLLLRQRRGGGGWSS